MKTFLDDVGGFTPAIDVLTKIYGPITSLVFGRAWRYCQGNKRVCCASIDTIAKELNLSQKTVTRHMKILVKDGLLEDCSPKLRNHPHTYRDTGYAQELADKHKDDQHDPNKDSKSELSAEDLHGTLSPGSRTLSLSARTQLPGGLDNESREDRFKKEKNREVEDRESQNVKFEIDSRILNPSTAPLIKVKPKPISVKDDPTVKKYVDFIKTNPDDEKVQVLLAALNKKGVPAFSVESVLHFMES